MSAIPSHLLSPVTLGALELPNRVVMAPLTRSRADNPARVPTALHAEYYRQRAGAGLIVSEATSISPQGVGYVHTPGIWSDEQAEAWKPVVEGVHAAGGRMFLQLWHVGRVSHRAFQPGGTLPVSASAGAFPGEVMLPDYSKVPFESPRALETGEIAGVVADYAEAARRARAAGFDGVEIHGANAYLIDQFLRDGCNRRTDAYGGSIENRCRFALEVVDAVVAEWGAGRVGLRLSPTSPWHGMSDSDPVALFTHLAHELASRPLAYLHVNEARPQDASSLYVTPTLRAHWPGRLILCTGYDGARADAAIAAGEGDLVAFGVPWISNPDLVARFAQGAALNAADPATFYRGGPRGYTDYPTLNAGR